MTHIDQFHLRGLLAAHAQRLRSQADELDQQAAKLSSLTSAVDCKTTLTTAEYDALRADLQQALDLHRQHP